jgi:hypothetical protein
LVWRWTTDDKICCRHAREYPPWRLHASIRESGIG